MAVYILSLCDGINTIDKIKNIILEKFDVDKDLLDTDIGNLMTKLEHLGIIEVK